MINSASKAVSTEFSVFFGCTLTLITIIGTLANLFVIIAVLGDRKMRKSSMNILLLSLAAADMLYVISFVYAWLPILVYGNGTWMFPDILCAPVRYLSSAFLTVSTVTYMTICIERYIALIHPLKATRLCSRKNVIITIILTWTIILLFDLPYFFLYEAITYFGQSTASYCINPYSYQGHLYWLIYKWVEFAVSYAIPCVVSVVLYAIICRNLWFRDNTIHNDFSRMSTSNANSTDTSPTEVDNISARRNVVKMLIVCVIVFYIAYTPMVSILVYQTIWKQKPSILTFETFLVVVSLVIGISAFNPFLYTLFSKTFRKRANEILTCSETSRFRIMTYPTSVKTVSSSV
ncbi:7 transmembrane receptor (rhodopsin family) domain-containing protein [Ditylenchus destructor]|nr:7 transmembrane receptor (rhodopsin family) domain-containing protein [Ditylenchus destructor]